ncbi:MAG: helix-turn-helix transcriptional regulator, partial [Ilumatobacteraceae bacterium]|nr:helix-turn-helix transcriptional regulator [Ilumatobacteraceae bacterium]
MPIHTDPTLFASELKRWRHHRRYSQLQLANQAQVSQRHLSFLENGRSRPSPEMVEHLSIVLGVPLRARNALLNAAGFADAYSEEPLQGAALAQIRETLHTLVEAHNPYPAYIVDRSWNLLDANTAAANLTALLFGNDTALELATNVLRLFLHPDGARHAVTNWPEAAAVLVERLATECANYPGDPDMRALYDEVISYPDVATGRGRVAPPHRLRTAIAIDPPHITHRRYTTKYTHGAPGDVTRA